LIAPGATESLAADALARLLVADFRLCALVVAVAVCEGEVRFRINNFLILNILIILHAQVG